MAFFPSLKQNFIAYHSSSCPDCIFEIHQLWQSGFSRVYSNCCCSYLFEPEIIKIGQSSHKMYSNNILNFQESTTIYSPSLKRGTSEKINFFLYTLSFLLFFHPTSIAILSTFFMNLKSWRRLLQPKQLTSTFIINSSNFRVFCFFNFSSYCQIYIFIFFHIVLVKKNFY